MNFVVCYCCFLEPFSSTLVSTFKAPSVHFLAESLEHTHTKKAQIQMVKKTNRQTDKETKNERNFFF